MTAASGIRTVGLCLRPESRAGAEVARGTSKWLVERGLRVMADSFAGEALGVEGHPRAEVARGSDLLVVLGGDGTILSVARELGENAVPILGVNLGRLGFLAEVTPDELLEDLERVLAGEMQTVRRMRLEVSAEREGRELGRFLAINDAVITRSDLSRMIDLEALSDDVPVTTYHGDGLIVATPTGSTAYSLSAGGPILMPDIEAFVLTPICPHALSQRPLVLPQTSRIAIRVFPREGAAQLTLDGQSGLVLRSGDTVLVRRSEHPVPFVVSPSRSRFDVLRSKLRWGAH